MKYTFLHIEDFTTMTMAHEEYTILSHIPTCHAAIGASVHERIRLVPGDFASVYFVGMMVLMSGRQHLVR